TRPCEQTPALRRRPRTLTGPPPAPHVGTTDTEAIRNQPLYAEMTHVAESHWLAGGCFAMSVSPKASQGHGAGPEAGAHKSQQRHGARGRFGSGLTRLNNLLLIDRPKSPMSPSIFLTDFSF